MSEFLVMDEPEIYVEREFLLFAGEDYYPNGGWGDFKGCFETEDDAKEHFDMLVSKERFEPDSWGEIVSQKLMLSIWTKHRKGKWKRETKIPVTNKLNEYR